MLEEIKKAYKSRCVFNQDCSPVFTLRSYQSGVQQCRTQCEKCGLSVGQIYSKKNVEKSYPLKPFDEELAKKCQEDWTKEMLKIGDTYTKLNHVVTAIKKEYFLNVLGLEYSESGDAYKKYLATKHWKNKRRTILERDNYTCLFCKRNEATAVHHMSYRNLGNESDFELISVCRDCHLKVHGYKVDSIGLNY